MGANIKLKQGYCGQRYTITVLVVGNDGVEKSAELYANAHDIKKAREIARSFKGYKSHSIKDNSEDPIFCSVSGSIASG